MRRARPARASIGAARMLDDILPYYESELTALRKLSHQFAGRYPKIASRLLLEGDTSEAPDRTSLVQGKSVSVRVDLRVRRILNITNITTQIKFTIYHCIT